MSEDKVCIKCGSAFPAPDWCNNGQAHQFFPTVAWMQAPSPATSSEYHGVKIVEDSTLNDGEFKIVATSSDAVTISRETLETLDIMTCLGRWGQETSWTVKHQDRVSKATRELKAALGEEK